MGNYINLRPSNFDEFFGQEQIVKELKVYIYSAMKRNDTLDHLLFFGPSGTGKTTLAMILANELHRRIRTINAPMIESIQDLVEILASIQEGDILFIDEIHRLDKKIEEVLYSAMEDFKLALPYKSEEKMKIVMVNLPKFTLIGATTLDGMIAAPLRERFGIKFHFTNYSKDEISLIVKQNMSRLNLNFDNEDLYFEFASRTKLNPRITNNLVKRLYDYAIYNNIQIISQKTLQNFFDFMKIDIYGINALDKNIISIMYEKFGDNPVSLESLASIMNENVTNLKEITEPFLVSIGFISRTRRGRVLTKLGKTFYWSNINK
ncbi:MAG: Holliday junction branch migration DNA helicase RuvB [Bacilli bacterium]|nr:Holliday junction branch migration DNA helicase RuvB [Bacilli bacterium]